MQQKTAAYLAAGAIEVWRVGEHGTIEMFDASGQIPGSSLGIVMDPLKF